MGSPTIVCWLIVFSMLYCACTWSYVVFSGFSQLSRNFLANFREGARKRLNRAENRGGLGIIRDDLGSYSKVLKTVWVWKPTGVRIPLPPPTKRELLSIKSSLFVYPSRRLGISSPHNVRCISSAPLGLYLITRQRASYCGLMRYNTSCWWYAIPSDLMIYTSSAWLGCDCFIDIS